MNLILQSLLSIQHNHLALTCIDFQSTSPTHLNKPTHQMTHHTLPSHLHTRGQVISFLSPLLQESRIPPPHPHFHLHHCIDMYIEKPRGHDTALSHPTVYPKPLTHHLFLWHMLNYQHTYTLNSTQQLPSHHTLSTPAIKLPYFYIYLFIKHYPFQPLGRSACIMPWNELQ